MDEILHDIEIENESLKLQNDQLNSRLIALEEELRRMEAEYKRISVLANEDALTHLPNRFAYLAKESELDNDKANDIACVMIDISRLKYVNDNFGHAGGDQYICGVASILSGVFGSSVYRLGGDEFCAVLYNRSKEEVEEMLASVNNIVEQRIKFTGSEEFIGHIDYGVAVRNKGENERMEDLKSMADDLMYMAKAEYYEKSGHQRRV